MRINPFTCVSLGLLGALACSDLQDPEASGANETEVAVTQQDLNLSRHQFTTQLGVGPWVTSSSTFSSLISNSMIGDLDFSVSNKSQTHFDNCYWEEGRAWVAQKRAAALTNALTWYQSQTSANRSAVFEQLGYVLHATQDFYAHSNWAETHASGAIAAFDDIPTRPDDWYSGTYDNSGDTGPNAGYLHCPPDKRFTHSQMNKDGVGGLSNDEAFIDASAATSDQMRRFVAAIRDASPSAANAILSGLGFVTTDPATTTWRSDYTRTIAPAGGPWGQTGASLFCKAGTYVAAFRQRVESSQGLGDDTALNAIEFYCRDGAGSWTERLNTWDGAWGDYSGWGYCASGAINGGSLKVEPVQRSGDDSSANGAHFSCTNGALLSVSNDGAWGSYLTGATCPSGEAVCGAQAIVEPPIGGTSDDTALNGIRLHCCTR
jgi:hypothetical protein